MKEFYGRSVPTKLEELVDARYTVLVIVDVQNDLCEMGGALQKLGRHLSKGNAIIRKLQLLIREARKVGVKIFYIQGTGLSNHSSDSAARLRYFMKDFGLSDPELVPDLVLEGSWGQRIVEDIRPVDGDLVVKKNRPSAFYGTNLDLLLRTNGIKTVLIAGLTTQVCVEATARDAENLDYFVAIVRDCVDSTNKDLHDAALKVMEARYEVVDSDQVIEVWKKKQI